MTLANTNERIMRSDSASAGNEKQGFRDCGRSAEQIDDPLHLVGPKACDQWFHGLDRVQQVAFGRFFGGGAR